MPLPDDFRVAGFRPFFGGMAEGCVPAPGIGTDNFYAAFGQIQRSFRAQTDTLIGEVVSSIDRTRLDEDDVQRRQRIVNACQLSRNLVSSNHVAMRHCAKIQFHARAQKPVQRCFIYTGGRACTAVGGRMVMPGRVHMGAVMCGQFKHLYGPTFAIRQVILFQAREEHSDLFPARLVGNIFDLRSHHLGIRDDIVGDRDGKVDEACHSSKH